MFAEAVLLLKILGVCSDRVDTFLDGIQKFSLVLVDYIKHEMLWVVGLGQV